MTKEEAKTILKELHDNSLFSVRTALETFFPELKESDDEGIRKELVEWLKRKLVNPSIGFNPAKMEKWIAYLEKMKDFDKQLEQAYKKGNGVFFSKGYDAGYAEGKAFAKQELVKQNEKPATISVDKMVDEFENFKVISCGRIPSFMEIDAYRKGVNDVLSKILIKEEKPITLGSKKAEGKLGEMIAASKKSAESGEDKELTHSQATKKSDKDSRWNAEDEDVYRLIKNKFVKSFIVSSEELSRVLDWFKSIKDRVQPQPKST